MIPDAYAESRMAIGYLHGRPFPLMLVRIEGKHWAESATAAAFLAMREEAARVGVTIQIREAFREHADQERIYTERQDPEVRRLRGPAAKPGWSMHQSGRALDLIVGLTMEDHAAGKTSVVFDWLAAHAGEFGFKRPWKFRQGEPWHWEHVGVRERREGGL